MYISEGMNSLLFSLSWHTFHFSPTPSFSEASNVDDKFDDLMNVQAKLFCLSRLQRIYQSRPTVIFPDIKYPNSCFQALVGVRGSMPSPRKIWFPVRKGHESDVLAGNGQKWGEYDICHEGFGQPRKLVNRGWHHELTWYMWCVFINAGETMKYHSAPLCTPPGSHIRSSRQHTPVCMHNAAENPPTILKMRWDR